MEFYEEDVYVYRSSWLRNNNKKGATLIKSILATFFFVFILYLRFKTQTVFETIIAIC